jgi:hypothetical protein
MSEKRKLHQELIEHRIQIGSTCNQYGFLIVSQHAGRSFWAIEDCRDPYEWEEISESLYNELLKHNERQVAITQRQ